MGVGKRRGAQRSGSGLRSGMRASGISHGQDVATGERGGAGESGKNEVFAKSASILRIPVYTTYESVSNSCLPWFGRVRSITSPEVWSNLGKPDLDRSDDMSDSIHSPRFPK